MNYYDSFKKFCHSWDRVESLRESGFLNKHLSSLPAQWRKRHYIRQVKKVAGELPDKSPRPVEKDLVVSLTTYPARISTVHLPILSILKGDVVPEKILLWLTEEEFPERERSLPPQLVELLKFGLEIFFSSYNVRSHNKYMHSALAYPDKTIVTIDDDLIYTPDTLSRLIRLHEKYPEAVCSNRVREIAIFNGTYAPYPKWRRIIEKDDTASLLYTALGYGGVLYPPGVLTGEVNDPSLCMDLAPRADDLWLKVHQIIKRIEVATPAGWLCGPITIDGTDQTALQITNHLGGQNDVQWRQLEEHYGMMKILTEQ